MSASAMPAMSIEKRHLQKAEPMSDRVVRLYPRLIRAARGLQNSTSRTLDADDLTQGMVITLLEHEYLDVDGYCVKFSKKRAISRLRSDTTYRTYVAPMPTMLGEDDEVLDYDEFLPSPSENPEDALIAKERRAELLARLSQVQRRVIDLLAAGYSKSEIADMLGVSRPRVSQHIETLRAALAAETR